MEEINITTDININLIQSKNKIISILIEEIFISNQLIKNLVFIIKNIILIINSNKLIINKYKLNNK